MSVRDNWVRIECHWLYLFGVMSRMLKLIRICGVEWFFRQYFERTILVLSSYQYDRNNHLESLNSEKKVFLNVSSACERLILSGRKRKNESEWEKEKMVVEWAKERKWKLLRQITSRYMWREKSIFIPFLLIDLSVV